jgi:protein-tyrosine phosphatase
MAEVLLRRGLDAAGVAASVSSAGVWRADEAASPGSVRAMAARGLDLTGHRSRLVGAEDLVGADLVIGMAREHVREAVVSAPEIFGRAFTLKELVRRGAEAGPPAGGLAHWLATLAAGRRPVDLLGESADDDIADPIGAPDPVYERTAVEIEGLVTRLVSMLAQVHREPVA